MNKVYAVVGVTGEWEDIYHWTFSVYSDKSEAKSVASILNARLKKDGIHSDKWDDWNGDIIAARSRKYSSVDPLFRVDYTGVRYYTQELRMGVDISSLGF